MLSFGAAQLPTAVLPEDDLTNRGDRFCFVHLSIEALSAFSFPRKLRERLCLVSARDKKFARHSIVIVPRTARTIPMNRNAGAF
jgi:hypothetical protein